MASQGYRVLVDRIWPRGVSKEKANIDLWMKEIAPSTDLRKWFNHDSEKWSEFKKKYKTELKEKEKLINDIKVLEQEHKNITLLYSAKNIENNQAVVLLDILRKEKIDSKPKVFTTVIVNNNIKRI